MIQIKKTNQIEIMREGGALLGRILKIIGERAKPGVSTAELDKVARDLVFACGAKPAFEGYEGFPGTICTSVNEQIVHGAPSDQKLKKGDVVGLDLGVLYPVGQCSSCPLGHSCNPTGEPFFTDAAITVAVGEASAEAAKLIFVAKKALDLAIEKIKPGIHLSDISAAIQKYVESEGFSVIRNLVGHGVGKELHEEPEIPNFGQPGQGPILKEGMVLAIEPMIAAGHYALKQSADGFGYETKDESLTAHFEHTIAVTKNGGEVLTKA
ncbi:MAG: type I methionyl aminopeptidase [Candidatus Portnoybacteria bacterium]|nr:type I methionyl aminopeptidase [Candidatus Portnoybacteria bacterium]